MVPNSQSTKYLFDFIYIDRPRLNSYFGQLYNAGVLTQVKETSGKSDSSIFHGELGVPMVAQGKITDTGQISESAERSFDSSWTLPVTLLNRLDELGYLRRSLAEAGISELVLVEGSLRLFDIRMMRELWEPALELHLDSIKGATRQERDKIRNDAKNNLTFIKRLPHTLQFSFKSGEDEAWSTLNPDYMTINPDDLAFKHGAFISGEWFAFGVMDARPDIVTDDAIRKIPGIHTELDLGFAQMLIAIRTAFGRPSASYGITPIMIFRRVPCLKES